jgi:hypothetical protein
VPSEHPIGNETVFTAPINPVAIAAMTGGVVVITTG